MIESPFTRDIRYLVSGISDPAVNLAVEETLLSQLPSGQTIVLLYRNAASVICGRFQNPWLEADVDWLQDNGIPLLRRVSGGGTVWHDPGNWNFSFICSRNGFDQLANLGFLSGILATLGFSLETTTRGDLLLNGRKVSGNAMVKKDDRVMHHCSLLVDADLGLLRKALKAPETTGLVFNSRGVGSVRSSVTRLADHGSPDQLSHLGDELVLQIAKKLHTEPQTPTVQEIAGAASLIDRNREWQWNYGRTPEFSIKGLSPGGDLLIVKNGLIQSGHLADATQLGDKPFPGFAALARMGFVGFNDR